MENYIAQRLAAIGAGSDAQKEIDALRIENARLKEQIGQAPTTNFKSEAQVAFEQSPEFEQILNAFYLRFVRDKFGLEFNASPYLQAFQGVANQAFERYEKSYRQQNEKEAPKASRQAKKAGGESEEETKE